MRDINRIDKVLAEVGEQWKRLPDWRLGQLFNNFQRREGNDLFYYEEDRFVEHLKAFGDEVLGEEDDE